MQALLVLKKNSANVPSASPSRKTRAKPEPWFDRRTTTCAMSLQGEKRTMRMWHVTRTRLLLHPWKVPLNILFSPTLMSSKSIPCEEYEDCAMMQEEEWEVLKVRSELKYGIKS
jgi:hypothetical protein